MKSKSKMSVLTRINAQFKRDGREERIIRGKGYYYVHSGELFGQAHSTSVPCFWLEPTEKDFQFARGCINDMFKAAGLAYRLPLGEVKFTQRRSIRVRASGAEYVQVTDAFDAGNPLAMREGKRGKWRYHNGSNVTDVDLLSRLAAAWKEGK